MSREITLDDQIACVAREIAFRLRCYPKWVHDKRMTQDAADREIATMKAVLNNLRDLQRAGVVASIEGQKEPG
jgi:predicted transcriptional regulator